MPSPPPDHFAQHRHSLLWRIRHRYTLTRVELPLTKPGHTIPFYRIANPDRVLDDVAAADSLRRRLSGHQTPDESLHLPYWAELWDSSLALASALISNPFPDPPTIDRRTLSVLDLGCGMGAAGAAAIALGHRVLMADIEPDALLLAELNGLLALQHAPPPQNPRALRTRQLDWRNTKLAEHFDLILGADVLYEISQWPMLEHFWLDHLRDNISQVLLAEPGRQTGSMFIDWIQPRNWTLQLAQVTVPTSPRPVRVLRLTRPQLL